VLNATFSNISAISWQPVLVVEEAGENHYNIRLHVHFLRFYFLLLAVASDKAYQLHAHGRWFSPASSTTKTGRHDIAEILLKVALSTKNQINQLQYNTIHTIQYRYFISN
jgi:hypothetical protein